MIKENTLYVEKYRPKVISDLILPERIQNIVNGFIEKQDIPNLIFYGPAGTVKTTTAKAIINSLNAESIFINTSLDTGKGNITETILPFATGLCLRNPDIPKIILCDEFERATPQMQDACKALFEQVSTTSRFILTTNSLPKIIKPLQSRCICIDFNIYKDERQEVIIKFYKHITSILQENNIPIEDQKALQKFIMYNFPDYRKIMNNLQCFAMGYGKIDSRIYQIGDEVAASSFITALKTKNFDLVRKTLAESNYTSEEIINSLYKSLNEFTKKQIPNIIVILAEYGYRNNFVANQQLNMMACLTEIMNIL